MPSENLMPIPGLGHQDAGVTLSLLKGSGFFCHVHEAFVESPDVLVIRVSDLPAIKEFLREVTLRGERDEMPKIPW